MTSEEKKALDSSYEEIYRDFRRAAEAHRQVSCIFFVIRFKNADCISFIGTNVGEKLAASWHVYDRYLVSLTIGFALKY